MSFKTNSSASGIIIFDLDVALSKVDAIKLVREVEIALNEGKSKVILNLSTEAATGINGYGYIEKSFRGLKVLAQKLQGDIRYVLPKKIADRIPGTLPDLNSAIQSFALASPSSVDSTLHPDDPKLKEQLIFQESQIKRLTTEVTILTKKVKELMTIVSQPMTDKELKAAVEHYRILASEIESETGVFKDPAKDSAKR